MKLSIQEVEHIADLARLKLTEAEKQQYAAQLSNILDYAEKLRQLDTEHIPPTASILEVPLRLREDIARSGLSQDEVLRNSKGTQDGQFKVPPVFGD
jgi:aspartyl-tRNA(Asn)/glutamyl-tRNA(Gln) amidotransferase subunit C